MKALATALFLLALVLARPAAADPFARHALPNGAASTIVVPAAWSGVWVNSDTAYTCAGAFQSTASSQDTLCTGQSFSDTTLSCTGSADANTFTEHCTGSFDVGSGCTANYTVDVHGTRTNDTFFSVATSSITYTGAGVCSLLPPQCTQTNTHGSRIAPAPAAYCATPTEIESWGRLKAHYR